MSTAGHRDSERDLGVTRIFHLGAVRERSGLLTHSRRMSSIQPTVSMRTASVDSSILPPTLSANRSHLVDINSWSHLNILDRHSFP